MFLEIKPTDIGKNIDPYLTSGKNPPLSVPVPNDIQANLPPPVTTSEAEKQLCNIPLTETVCTVKEGISRNNPVLIYDITSGRGIDIYSFSKILSEDPKQQENIFTALKQLSLNKKTFSTVLEGGNIVFSDVYKDDGDQTLQINAIELSNKLTEFINSSVASPASGKDVCPGGIVCTVKNLDDKGNGYIKITIPPHINLRKDRFCSALPQYASEVECGHQTQTGVDDASITEFLVTIQNGNVVMKAIKDDKGSYLEITFSEFVSLIEKEAEVNDIPVYEFKRSDTSPYAVYA